MREGRGNSRGRLGGPSGLGPWHTLIRKSQVAQRQEGGEAVGDGHTTQAIN